MPEPRKSHKKSIRQKTNRRRKGLMRKASQYSGMCGADVFVGIRLKESGRLYTLLAESSPFWSFLRSQLDSYYPTPIHLTNKDFEMHKNEADDLPGGSKTEAIQERHEDLIGQGFSPRKPPSD
ncbi:hypothetical protein BBP40_007905 [Aspergillus hancockii]|nr:hypothetical protein BBP40_007905 [Aspergillus hancockii]